MIYLPSVLELRVLMALGSPEIRLSGSPAALLTSPPQPELVPLGAQPFEFHFTVMEVQNLYIGWALSFNVWPLVLQAVNRKFGFIGIGLTVSELARFPAFSLPQPAVSSLGCSWMLFQIFDEYILSHILNHSQWEDRFTSPSLLFS